MKQTCLLCGLFLALFSCQSDNSGEVPETPENKAPKNFSLLTIADNSTDVDLLASFTWDTAVDPEQDTVRYQFLLDENENPTTIISEGLDTPNYTLTEKLNTDTTYYWKVVAKDTEGNTTESGTAAFTTRGLVLSVTTVQESAAFSARSRHTTLVFDNKLWVIAGDYKNDVWSSTDGIIWNLATENAGFPGREFHTSLVFDNKMWVIGGQIITDSNGLALNDVWSSSDGINWNLETVNAAFDPRFLHSTVVFDDKMWIINGFDSNRVPLPSRINDVWYSEDGVDWVLATDTPELNATIVNEAVVFKDKIWVIAGNSNDGISNTVYASSNGIQWETITENAAFSKRNVSAAAVFQGRMWIFGRERDPFDVWYSLDGVSWFEASLLPEQNSSRFAHRVNVYNDAIFLIAGSELGVPLNDVLKLELQD